MAKLTREEVIARVKAGKSLTGEDLSGLDLNSAILIGANLNWASLRSAKLICANLRGAKLICVNLSGANLSNADLSWAYLGGAKLSKANLSNANLSWAHLDGANLREANLRESNLYSANLSDTDLSGVDLTGANIWNIATANWKIEGVKCGYVYNCKNWILFFSAEKEKTRRDFAPGEFEQIYKSSPKLELIFKKEFSHLDHRALLAIIDNINQELPKANLKLRKIEKVVDATATLTAETEEDTEKIADMLPEQYARILAEFARIQAGQAELKSLLAHQNHQSSSPPPAESTQLQESIVQLLGRLDKLPNAPDTVIIENRSRDFKKKFKEFSKAIGVELSGHTIFEILKEVVKHFFVLR